MECACWCVLACAWMDIRQRLNCDLYHEWAGIGLCYITQGGLGLAIARNMPKIVVTVGDCNIHANLSYIYTLFLALHGTLQLFDPVYGSYIVKDFIVQ